MSESKYLHEILVGNIGTVYSGHSTREAQAKFTTYKALSRGKIGRATGEDITWLRDNEVYREYHKPAPKLRVHNEHFSPVSMGNRKSCPTCGEKLVPGESVWSWYEYVRVQKRLIQYFCRACFATEVQPKLVRHATDCGCTFELHVSLPFSLQRPEWLTLETPEL